MPPPFLRYAITDRRLLRAHEGEAPPPEAGGSEGPPAELDGLCAQAACLREASVEYLQVREKDLPPPELRALAVALRRILPRGGPARLLLNLGSPEQHAETLALALALPADGVHLPAGLPATLPRQVRASFAGAGRPNPVVSVSVHSTEETARAGAGGADLLLFGPVFGKTVFGETPAGGLVAPALGVEALAAAVWAAGTVPVLALGGVTPANTAACLEAGARGTAGIRQFFSTRRLF